MIPRAAVCADRIQEVLDTDVVGACRRPRRSRELPRRTARSSSRDVGVPLPRRRARRCCATSRSPPRPGQTTAIIGSTGAGKTTLRQPDPAARSTPPAGAVLRRRRRRPRPRPRRRCGAASASCRRGRTCSPARWPATCATASPTPPTRSCGRRWRSPRRADFVRGDARAGSTRRSPRAAPTCPAASASGSRSPARWCASPRSTCSTTRSRRSTSPPTPACAPRSKPVTADATVIIVAQRVSTISDADQILVLEDGAIVGTGTHDELLATLPDLRRDRRVAARRAGGGRMSELASESSYSAAKRSTERQRGSAMSAPTRPARTRTRSPPRGAWRPSAAAADRRGAGAGQPVEKAMDFGAVRAAAGGSAAARAPRRGRWCSCSA